MPPQLHKACRRAACRTSFAAAQSFELAAALHLFKKKSLFLFFYTRVRRIWTRHHLKRAPGHCPTRSCFCARLSARRSHSWCMARARRCSRRSSASSRRCVRSAGPQSSSAASHARVCASASARSPPHPRRARCYSPQYACLTPLRALRRRSRRPCRATSSRGSTCRRFWRPTVIRRASPGQRVAALES